MYPPCMARRTCFRSDCKNVLPANRKKWCSDNCRKVEHHRSKTAAKRDHVTKGQEGDTYDLLIGHPDWHRYVNAEISGAEMARIARVSESQITKTLIAWNTNRARDSAAAQWAMADDVAWMLHVDPETRDPLPIPEDPDSPEARAFLKDRVEAFVEFSDRFFEAKKGRKYVFRLFHRRWLALILRCYFYGLKATILSPPRHGKSELLVRFCTYLISRDRDIQIMWVAKEDSVGKNMVGMVRRNLEKNLTLIDAVLPPNQQFAPRRRQGEQWTDLAFSVTGRSLSAKSPTMRLATRGGTILSLDTDFIVTDDIEDHKSTLQDHLRGKTRTWFLTDVDSRKEEHTGWLNIGSRQHADDLHGHLIDDPTWESIVDAAHEGTCELALSDYAAHNDCMLFPELRSFKWLMTKRSSLEAQGMMGEFEMIYLNAPRPAGQIVFVKEHVDAAKNLTRGLGLAKLPSDLQLVAGLDPAPVNYQAGFLWGVSIETQTAYMVDLDNRRGAGIDGFIDLGTIWWDMYGLTHWVVESTGWMRGYREEERVRVWSNLHGLMIEGHDTHFNKRDSLYGVGAMAQWYGPDATFKIDLPYGDEAAREKTDLYVRQMLGFSAESGKQKRPTDVLMASWFPTKVIRRMLVQRQTEMKVAYTPSHQNMQMTSLGSAPW